MQDVQIVKSFCSVWQYIIIVLALIMKSSLDFLTF